MRVGFRTVVRSPARLRVLELLRTRPGLRCADVSRELGIRYENVRHHLRVLEAAGEVVKRVDLARARSFRWFVNGAAPKEVGVVVLSAATERVLVAVRLRCLLSAGELGLLLGMKRSSCSWHLCKLNGLGLVVCVPGERGRRWAAVG